jgi:small-conductance mechanosensitive channel
METALLTAFISATTALVVMFLTQWISIRKDEIKFRREKAEELAKELQTILEGVYKIADANVFTNDPNEANTIRTQAQLVRRMTGSPELVIKLYFPLLERYWSDHDKSIATLTDFVFNNVGIQNADFTSFAPSVRGVFTTHDVVMKAIVVDYPQLTKGWFHSIRCQSDCCR